MTIHNHSQYLRSKIIEKCFIKGSSTNVDKQITGNGFTTAFSHIRPLKKHLNILIAPNKNVVKDKEEEYLNGKFGFKGSRMAFFYEGSTYPLTQDYDLLVFVVDSFINRQYYLSDILIDKILVDETHSVHIQMDFRRSLKRFVITMNESYNNTCSVAYVTATRTMDWGVDINIKNHKMTYQDVHFSMSYKKTLRRLIDKLNNGERCLVFTNESSIIKDLIKKWGHNEVDLRVGDKMKVSLYKRTSIIVADSNLVVVSSSGFEGWSDNHIDNNVFIFSNIDSKHAMYLSCQMVQALGRSRLGFKYAEVNIRDQSNGSGFSKCVTDNDVDELVDSFMNVNTTIEKKMTKQFQFKHNKIQTRRYHIDSCLYFDTSGVDVKVTKIPECVSILNERKNLEEKLDVDYFYEHGYIVRNIVEPSPSKEKKVPSITNGWRQNQSIALGNMIINDDKHLLHMFYFSDFFNKTRNKIDREKRRFIQKKPTYFADRYRVEYMNELYDLINMADGVGNKLPDRYYKLLEMYSNPNLLKTFVHNSKLRWRRKNYSLKEIRVKVEKLISTSFPDLLMTGLSICKGEVHSYGTSGHRDYNEFTKSGISNIKYICDNIGVSVFEGDISTAFPRILYGLCGLIIPNDFYGYSDDYSKRNLTKRKVNTVINNFMYKTKTKDGSGKMIPYTISKKIQKYNSSMRLLNIGLDKPVVNYLISNFFDDEYNRGKLFHMLSYYEKKIIKKITRKIDGMNKHDESRFIIRRHDSFLYFNDGRDISLIGPTLDSFNYLGQYGWF